MVVDTTNPKTMEARPRRVRKRGHVVSVTAIELYLRCALAYFFRYFSNMPSLTDFPRLLGTVVHQVIADFYKPVSAKKVGTREHPFYYESLKSAQGVFKYQYRLAVDKAVASGKLRPSQILYYSF